MNAVRTMLPPPAPPAWEMDDNRKPPERPNGIRWFQVSFWVLLVSLMIQNYNVYRQNRLITDQSRLINDQGDWINRGIDTIESQTAEMKLLQQRVRDAEKHDEAAIRRAVAEWLDDQKQQKRE